MPVLCGSAFKNKGVQKLLDAIVDFLPSPADLPPVEGFREKDGEPESRRVDDEESLQRPGLQDRHGRVLWEGWRYLRVYSGTLKAGEVVLNANTGKKERIGSILQMHANKREELEEARTGDIVAVSRVQADPHRAIRSAPWTGRSCSRR